MSNHYHVVLHVNYQHSLTWTDEEVVQRWTRLFPPLVLKDSDEQKRDVFLTVLAWSIPHHEQKTSVRSKGFSPFLSTKVLTTN
jgi:hypothetical protein